MLRPKNFQQFSSCAVTHSKTKAVSDSIQGKVDQTPLQKSYNYGVPGLSLLPASFSWAQLIAAQRDDPTLATLFDAALSPDEVQSAATGYSTQDGMLLRKWLSQSEDSGSESLVQTVVPTNSREVVLDVGHGPIAGHLGVKKPMTEFCDIFIGPC